MRRTKSRAVLWAATIALVPAVWMAGAIGCRRAQPRLVVELPEAPVRIADAMTKSKACADCHVQIAELFRGDKHIADDFYCVACHGESTVHRDLEVEGAMPDRTWRRWIAEKNRYKWRMKKATLQIARFCAGCHGKQPPEGKATKTLNWEAYIKTRHGLAVGKGKPDAPTCTDCHRAHGVGAEPWTDQLIEQCCAVCHTDKKMMRRAGLNPNVIADFEAGKHANMSAVFPEQKSSCTKCHPPHGQRPS